MTNESTATTTCTTAPTTATTADVPTPTTATSSTPTVVAPSTDNTQQQGESKQQSESQTQQQGEGQEQPKQLMQMDLAFCCDCTGSMGSYIKSAQENIRNIASSIHARSEGKADLKFALVKYRDHPPQDHTYITEAFPFTPHLELMKRHVDTMSADGGGDGPEAVAAALHAVSQLNWRPNATKIVVFIADAPPHGLGESGDGFPDGCPQGHDPIKICKDMAARGITVYAVGVEPVLSTSFKYARDFMMMVANVTDGKFLPLGKASVLTDVVVNGALEGACMEQVWADLEQSVAADAAKAGRKLTTEELIKETEQRLEAKKDEIVLQQIDVSNPYLDNYEEANFQQMTRATSLSEVRGRMNPNLNCAVPQQAQAYNWGAQSASYAPQPMQPQQAQRMTQQGYKNNNMYQY